jgi:hypothetical protein
MGIFSEVRVEPLFELVNTTNMTDHFKANPLAKKKLTRKQLQMRLIMHANAMQDLWLHLHKADPKGDGWHEVRAKQAYHDCLISLKNYGLIEDYNLTECKVKVEGEWSSNRLALEH